MNGPVAPNVDLFFSVPCTVDTFKSLCNSRGVVFLSFNEWQSLSGLLFSCVRENPLHVALVRGASSSRRSAVGALRRIESTRAWYKDTQKKKSARDATQLYSKYVRAGYARLKERKRRSAARKKEGS